MIQLIKEAWDRLLANEPIVRDVLIDMVNQGFTFDQIIDIYTSKGRHRFIEGDMKKIEACMRSQEFKDHMAGTLGLM